MTHASKGFALGTIKRAYCTAGPDPERTEHPSAYLVTLDGWVKAFIPRMELKGGETLATGERVWAVIEQVTTDRCGLITDIRLCLGRHKYCPFFLPHEPYAALDF